MTQDLAQFGAVKAAVLDAGAAILSLAPRAASRNPHCEEALKPDGSVVTQADLASEAILLDALQRYFPGDGVCSEESFSEHTPRRYRTRVWIVDPLDGSANLSRGQSDFAVLAARKEYGRLTFAIMHYPALGLTAEARATLGAFCNGERCRVSSSERIRPERILLVHCRVLDAAAYGVDMMESTQALLELARGACDGVIIRLCGHKVWDFSAAALIVEEAGGRITDGDGNPLIHDYARFDVPYVIASNGNLHDSLVDLLAAGTIPT